MDEQKQLDFLYEKFKNSNGVSTDSRSIKPGMIYFALKGEHFNGNKFAKDAIVKGARLAVVDDPDIRGEHFLHVKNSLESLQKLASFIRSKWTFPVLAIAGSNGKTTSKELISAVLSKKYNVFSTPGNFNNHIGLPLTILMVPDNCNFLVLEMGANHIGEHSFLCTIAKPNYGLVTNNGMDHLEGYGNLENVIKSNAELIDYLKSNKGKVFINADDEQMIQHSSGADVYSYGFDKKADFKAGRIEKDLFAAIKLESQAINSNLVGKFNEINILAASAIGHYFEVDFNSIRAAVESYKPQLNRSQLIDFKKFKVMLDAYNANPTSMHLAIKTIEESSFAKKMVILGGMLELGIYTEKEHKKIIDYLNTLPLDHIWLVGKEFKAFQNLDTIKHFESTEDCSEAFKSLDFENGVVLIKGSRKYQLEKLIE
ncbi:UDP-N-acetylmuramoyl-tripeptide--D-alanyl-D-alanine ligase [Hyphobacterium sp. CCMP332]|nr:UDP-N-acetylmuramoyl-tripeptide--D-alanyl-D-alanine ligase [Hyphobacterium sp. CCMP332]